jgi:thiol-disulfide isomerase/thioredoxin
MKRLTLSAIVLLLGVVLSLPARTPELIAEVKRLAWAKDVRQAQALIEAHRDDQERLTAEWLVAVSWLARGASFAEQWGVAERYAREAYDGSLELLKRRPLDADSHLPIALGASIEVLGQTYAGRGNRLAALEFLSQEHARYRGTSIEARLQKNFLLLSLEGKPFPGLERDQYLYRPPPTPGQLRGKVVLFYFWAHWCGDCKRQLPVLRELHADYAERGLVVVGPTRLYGYVARGEEASPGQELDYLRNAYRQKHPLPEWMGVPVSTRNFLRFGVSTTPTLVLVDRDGIVRLYNPGTLSYEELAAQIEALLG